MKDSLGTILTITKWMLIASLVSFIIVFPIISIPLIVVEIYWRKRIPSKLIIENNGIKKMPLLVPWICIPIPGTYVQWNSKWIRVNSPLQGNNPESSASMKNVCAQWSILSSIRGTDTLYLTNGLMDADFHQCKKHGKKAVVLKVPYWRSKDITDKWNR